MRILVVDGQGGGLGKAIIEGLVRAKIEANIIAVGTNAIATSAMIKAGALHAATGENAVVYNSKKADYILGAMGIAFANSMQGEITPLMATSIGESDAQKVLIPSVKCGVRVMGLTERPLSVYIDELIALLQS
jgi:hypothetical protein